MEDGTCQKLKKGPRGKEQGEAKQQSEAGAQGLVATWRLWAWKSRQWMPLKGLRQSDKIRLVLDKNFDCTETEWWQARMDPGRKKTAVQEPCAVIQGKDT